MRGSVVVVGVMLCSQAVFAERPVEVLAQREISKAAAKQDFETVVAWDDALVHDLHVDRARGARKTHFAALVDAKLAKLGAPTAANAQAIFGTLLGLKREAERDDADSHRRDDLSLIVAQTIIPGLENTAKLLWPEVDAMIARGDDARAVELGRLVIEHVPADAAFASKLVPLEQRIAAKHAALAREATDDVAAARVLHARLALIYGSDAVRALATPSQAMLSELRFSWLVDADSSCGDFAPTIDSPTKTLASVLRTIYPPGVGSSSVVKVTFASCPVVVADSETVEEAGYTTKGKVSDRVQETTYSCGNWSTTVDQGASTTTTTKTRSCGEVGTGAYVWKEREVEIEHVAKTRTLHRVHHMTAKGSIKVELAGITVDEPFSLEASSDDDPETSSDCPTTKDCPVSLYKKTVRRHGWSAGQARLRMHDKLVQQIAQVVGKARDRKAEAFAAKARAAVAAGKPLEADHHFAMAYQLRDRLDPAYEQWMEKQYRLPRATAIAAMGDGRSPKLDLAGQYATVLPKVSVTGRDAEMRDIQRKQEKPRTWITASIGPSFASTTGGSDGDLGIMGAWNFQVLGRHWMGGGRIGGGYFGHGLIDLEYFTGYGVRPGRAALHVLAGLGMDVTTGNDDRGGPRPDRFSIPAAAYFTYGARASYAAEVVNAKLEVLYTKTARTAKNLASEVRLDARLIAGWFALTMRYAEYFPDLDMLGSFDAKARSAKMLWLFGGAGF